MMNPQEQANRDPARNPIRMLMMLTLFVVSIFSMPAEMLWRRGFGTRYFGIGVMMISGPMFSMWALIVASMSAKDGSGLGVGVLLLPFLGLSWWHTIQIVRRMVDLREEYSYFDGDSLIVPWHRLPGGNSWSKVRFLYEPGATLALGMLLSALGLSSGSLSLFFGVSALALLTKAAILWWASWEMVRDLLDSRWMAKNMRGMMKAGQPAPTEILSVATLPWIDGLPLSVQTAVRGQMAKRLPPEYQSMLSKLEPAAEGEGQKEAGPMSMSDLAGLLSSTDDGATEGDGEATDNGADHAAAPRRPSW